MSYRNTQNLLLKKHHDHRYVQVDPTGLEPGVHTAYVNAYDAQQPEKGPLFEVPITVVRPEPLTDKPRPHLEHKDVLFGPGDIKRHFVKIPEGATWAVVRIGSNEKAASAKFIMHTVQLSPSKSVMHNNHEKMVSITENSEWTYGLAVDGKAFLARAYASSESTINPVLLFLLRLLLVFQKSFSDSGSFNLLLIHNNAGSSIL